jgi:diaminohydroxyphosphoribosylaminopyrimidine deaminase/5-amino-6-(5-phosphoribosylamino)uracil reductase
LRGLLRRLAAEGIISVLVEGGSEVLGSFMDAGLADRAYWFLSPKILGSQKAQSAIGGRGVGKPSSAASVVDMRIEKAGSGFLLSGRISRTLTH